MAALNYSQAFNATTSWSATSDGYEIAVTAATHGMGNIPCAEVWIADSANYCKAEGYPSNGYRVVINNAGTVTLKVSDSGRFAGKIVIANLMAGSGGGSSVSVDTLTTPATQNALQAKINEIIRSLSGGAVSSGPYSASFGSDGWETEAGGYYLEFPAALHGRGTNLFVDIWEMEGTNLVQTSGYPSTGYRVVCDNSGNVSIHTASNGRFAGKIMIR